MRSLARWAGFAVCLLLLTGPQVHSQPKGKAKDSRCPAGTHVEKQSDPTFLGSSTSTLGGTATIPGIGGLTGSTSTTIGTTFPGNTRDVCLPDAGTPAPPRGQSGINRNLSDPKALDAAIKNTERELADAELKYEAALAAWRACLEKNLIASTPPTRRGNPGGVGFCRKPVPENPCKSDRAALDQAMIEEARLAAQLDGLMDMKANPGKYAGP